MAVSNDDPARGYAVIKIDSGIQNTLLDGSLDGDYVWATMEILPV